MGDRFNLRDYSSPLNFHTRNEQLVREYQISLEAMQLLREKLSDCVRSEGVNHYTKCKDLREQYFELCTDRFRGMVLPPEAVANNRSVPGLIGPKK